MSIVSKAVLLVSLGVLALQGNAVAQNAPVQKPAAPQTNATPGARQGAAPQQPNRQATAPNTGVKPTPAAQPAGSSGTHTMQMYQMVFLKAGPNRNQDSATSAGLQAGHIANIKRLAREGKIVLAGPFGDKGEVRGIFIMNVASAEEAKRLCDSDPAIIAGRLSVEIRPWYGPKGLTYEGKEASLAD